MEGLVLAKEQQSDPERGALLAGKFRVLEKLGAGGMSAVFRAEHVTTGKQVAIKAIRADSPEAASRLLREAAFSRLLEHPNIVHVHDVTAAHGAVLLIMELLEGESLRTYLERHAQPNYAEFIALMLPALDAIAEAHALGVIHRDLKPENILLVRGAQGPKPTVLDFGIAAISTEPGELAGTPLYMPPEALLGAADVGEATDVYALGVLFYEALTGVRPHEAKNLPELTAKVLDEPLVPIRQLRPDVPEKLASLVEWALAKNQQQRMPSVRKLIEELAPFAEGRGVARRARLWKAEARPVRTELRLAPGALFAGLAALALVALLTAVLSASRGSGSRGPTLPPSAARVDPVPTSEGEGAMPLTASPSEPATAESCEDPATAVALPEPQRALPPSAMPEDKATGRNQGEGKEKSRAAKPNPALDALAF